MKKLLVLLLTLGLCCSACGKKPDDAAKADAPKADAAAADAPKADDAAKADAPKADAAAKSVASPEALALLKDAEHTQDGLVAMCKSSEDNLSPAEFEALVLAYAECTLSDVHLKEGKVMYKDCPADKAWVALTRSKKNFKPKTDPAMQEILVRLTHHESPIVRNHAYTNIDAYKVSDDTMKTLISDIMVEQDPIVAAGFISKLLTRHARLNNNPDMQNLAKTKAKDASPFVRKAVASSLDAKNKENKEFNDLMLSLCKDDADQKVRDVACGRIVLFDIPDKMKIAEELLKDRSLVDLHDLLLANLCKMWDPSDKIYDADAYRLWLDYFKYKPRSQNMVWRSFSNAFNVSDEWRQKATYYNEKEFLDVMADLVNDTEAKGFARVSGIKMIALFGGKEKGLPLLQDIQKKNEGSPKYSEIKNDLEKKIAELSK